ncbi:MAG: VOC family protein [Actinomycetota bacterium]|nr:VOC family protein [Actinomycetota bacterium]
MSAHITIVTLGVADVGRSSSFYEALGFHRSSASQAEISFFQAGAVVLSVFGHEALAQDAEVQGAHSGFRGVTIAMNLGSAAEVDTEYARWVAAGATQVKAPVAAEWGGYSSYVADPDGHLWELAHNPYLPLRPDGSGELAD